MGVVRSSGNLGNFQFRPRGKAMPILNHCIMYVGAHNGTSEFHFVLIKRPFLVYVLAKDCLNVIWANLHNMTRDNNSMDLNYYIY